MKVKTSWSKKTSYLNDIWYSWSFKIHLMPKQLRFPKFILFFSGIFLNEQMDVNKSGCADVCVFVFGRWTKKKKDLNACANELCDIPSDFLPLVPSVYVKMNSVCCSLKRDVDVGIVKVSVAVYVIMSLNNYSFSSVRISIKEILVWSCIFTVCEFMNITAC